MGNDRQKLIMEDIKQNKRRPVFLRASISKTRGQRPNESQKAVIIDRDIINSSLKTNHFITNLIYSSQNFLSPKQIIFTSNPMELSQNNFMSSSKEIDRYI